MATTPISQTTFLLRTLLVLAGFLLIAGAEALWWQPAQGAALVGSAVLMAVLNVIGFLMVNPHLTRGGAAFSTNLVGGLMLRLLTVLVYVLAVVYFVPQLEALVFAGQLFIAYAAFTALEVGTLLHNLKVLSGR